MTRHFQVEPTAGEERSAFTLLQAVERLSAPGQYALAAVLTIVVFALDVATGAELAFSIFYLGPIALIAWHRDRTMALTWVVISGLIWLLADQLNGREYTNQAIQYWNALVRTGFFVIVALTLTHLRRALDDQQRLARTDALTGVANSRFFLEIAEQEVARQHRYEHPLSIAFLDCDDFKEVNDRFGHAAGDDLLKRIAGCVESTLREVDLVARLGGDEFAILLPETDAAAATVVCEKVRDALRSAVHTYQVTFSIGLVTYYLPPSDVEELLHMADEAMYEAKKTGKNSSRHRIIGETRTASGTQV